jgi:signal transduction histidine kinase
MDDEGRLYSLVHYLKDVTEQKRLEQQLIRSDRLASLGTLVAGIAHEINNPLGIIAGYAEALLDRAKDPSLLENPEFEDFPEYLQTVHNEIFRCKGILRSLLDFARPSGGTFREIDINELIKEVILLINHRAKRLNHNVARRLDRDIPKIYAEPGNLRQVFMNIIMNSMYFTPEGGSITIMTEMDRDTAPARREGTIRMLSDTGAGINGIIERSSIRSLLQSP